MGSCGAYFDAVLAIFWLYVGLSFDLKFNSINAESLLICFGTTETKSMNASFIEELSADAVVVLYSWSKQKSTKARMIAWGNTFATKGMLEWAYHDTFEDDR